MEAVRIILRGQAQKDHALKTLMDIEFNPEMLLELTIKPYKKNRSLEQNDFLWALNTAYADYTGYSKNEAHEVLMREFLEPRCFDGPNGIIEVYSTKGLGVKEMNKYLETLLFYFGAEQIPYERKELP